MAFNSIALVPGSKDHSTALENDRQIATGAGRLLQLSVYNDKATAQYIQLHDVAAAPNDGAVPFFIFEIAPKTLASIVAKSFTLGLYVCNSSTAATKTIGGNDCWFYSERK